ncbi:MAG: bifunctional (p)ppGpp synthetase/guanosine-3',5'-bis(diphosphate) 3'-pyrophosphohydrolase [Duodenibacillus sp.]|nr:bifunctional (p)ppGpp synthetase/guanosine-3',5'-bis(diphosphate) 3'-pyrophosphohydrolase [Duodenibacillus sp.]
MADSEAIRTDWKLARRVVEPVYQGAFLPTGEPCLEHADGMVDILKTVGQDDELFAAAYLFHSKDLIHDSSEWIEKTFGVSVRRLVEDFQRLMQVNNKTRQSDGESGAVIQPEEIRRMLLAMCTDLRVVILRLASRLQTLRWYANAEAPGADRFGRETLALYAPLANRLGIWQMKWELEDLSLRFTQPKVYHEIVRELDESREERLLFMEKCVKIVKELLERNGIKAEVSGRPKHIFSIYKKMERKHLRFDQLFDIRAMRIIVDSVEHCYEVLSIVQEHFTIIEKEYDDYIAHPKPNGYQSLHTVMRDPEGKPVEIQIRSRAMHEFAELGVAAHWHYKEAGNSNKDKAAEAEERRVAWLRQILAWKSDVDAPSRPGVTDDHVYALTPQGRVLELQDGATPIDFAYQLHTELGHRCRGARVNGVMVPLNTKLRTGQTVEIVTAKTGGPSRDWLNPELGYAVSARTRTKVRQWFNAQQLAEQTQAGRERLDKELARLGKTAVKLEDIAQRLGYDKVEDLCVAFAKDELSTRSIEQAVQPAEEDKAEEEEIHVSHSRAAKGGVLVVGVDSLLTQLARCCHPAPPDEIIGFVTRGRGVTIHRMDCPNVRNLSANSHERMIEVSWGKARDALYPVEILVIAKDRVGLIRDITEIISKQKQNLIGMNTKNVKGDAHMRFSVEIASTNDLQQTLALIRDVKGVMLARRA